MKLVKLSIFALAMGLFATSCGDTTNEDEMMEDTTTVITTEPMVVDTIVAPMADSTAMMADTTMMNR